MRALVTESRVQRFEIEGERIRAVADRRRAPRVHPPDILYHAVTDHDLEKAQEKGCLRPATRKPVCCRSNMPCRLACSCLAPVSATASTRVTDRHLAKARCSRARCSLAATARMRRSP